MSFNTHIKTGYRFYHRLHRQIAKSTAWITLHVVRDQVPHLFWAQINQGLASELQRTGVWIQMC